MYIFINIKSEPFDNYKGEYIIKPYFKEYLMV